MKKLEVVYRDGGRIRVTNKRKNCSNDIFKNYMGELCPYDIESAILYTYPLKDNTPLILIKDGETINNL